MKISLKEGWISLSTVYSSGGEQWQFHKEKPDYVDETYLAADPGELVPGKLIRIMYCEAEPQISTQEALEEVLVQLNNMFVDIPMGEHGNTVREAIKILESIRPQENEMGSPKSVLPGKSLSAERRLLAQTLSDGTTKLESGDRARDDMLLQVVCDLLRTEVGAQYYDIECDKFRFWTL